MMKWKIVSLVLLLTLVLSVSDVVRPARSLNVSFSSPVSLPNASPYDNDFSKLLQLENGTVVMVWEKIVGTAGGQIHLMANNGFGWGGDVAIVSDGYDNISPSVAQLDNGSIMLVWSKGIAGSYNSYNIYGETYANGKWSMPSAIVSASPSNFDPVLAKMVEGSVWLVWSRSSQANGNGDLYYKIFKNKTWGSEAIIPTASSPSFEEKLPSVAQTADGRVWVVYETNASGASNLYATTTTTGSAWTPATAFTSSTDSDKWPNITQDGNGSVWVFWARELSNGSTPPPNPQPQYQWDIFYKMSANNGTSWSADTSLYNNVDTDEQHPSVMYGPDKELWVVFDTCCNSLGNPYGNPNLFLVKSSPIPDHDIGVDAIVISPSANPRVGENATFSVRISDPGSYSESSTVIFYVNATTVGSRTININPGTTVSLTFVWGTAGRSTGRYSARAIVAQVRNEFVTWNNGLNSTFLLTFRGDTNRDGTVGLEDLVLVASHNGASRGSPNYFADADLNRDGTIDVSDLVICAVDQGKTLF